MKVLHVISSISRTGGGPSRSVQGLVAALEAVGVEAHLLAIKPFGEPWIDGISHFRCIGKKYWFGVQKSIGKIIDEIQPDLIHIHSIWQLMLHFAAAEARKKQIPYILAPRGTLEKWSLKQKWLKKKLALITYQGHDLQKAAAIHVTAQSELEQCRALGLKQRIIFSPNGINIPDALPPKMNVENGFHRILFLSRMHEKKGVINFVESWGRIRPTGWQVELVYTAQTMSEKSYESKVRARVIELGLKDSFIFSGAMTDEEKWAAYRHADAFVLPSYSENFGIVVAEALYAGLPVITTTGTPWNSLIQHGCGWWISLPNQSDRWDEMDTAIKELVSLPQSELTRMGRLGHDFVCKEYSWNGIAVRMKSAYETILNDRRSHDNNMS